MTTHQAFYLLLDVGLVVALARLLAAVARRLDQPAVIGEVVAGILVGPTLFGGAIARALFPTDTRPLLSALANLGVALFMFLIGLELDPALLRGRRRAAVAVSAGALLLPFGGGVLVALGLGRGHPSADPLAFVLFVGTAMSVTAFPVLARIIGDRGLTRTPVGGLALACAAIVDVVAWSMLAVVVTLAGGGQQQLWKTALLVPYGLVLLALRPLLKRLLAREPGIAGLALVVAAVLLSGAATEWFGLHFLFGAFLFGVVVPRPGTERARRALELRLGEFTSTLLLPIYFVVAGLAVNLSGIGLSGLAELGLIIGVAVTGKTAGVFAGARLSGLPTRESGAMSVLMNTRGLTELVVLGVGLQLKILDGELYSLMVAMAVVTTAMAAPLMRVLLPRDAVAAGQEFLTGVR